MFEDADDTNIRGVLGLDFKQWFEQGSGNAWGYHAGLAVHQQIKDGDRSVLASDAGTGSPIAVVMLDPNKTTGRINGGLDLRVDDFTVFVDANYAVASDSRQYGMSGGVRFDF